MTLNESRHSSTYLSDAVTLFVCLTLLELFMLQGTFNLIKSAVNHLNSYVSLFK